VRGIGSHLIALACWVSLPLGASAQCAAHRDYRTTENSGIIVTDATITGTTSLNSDELASIARASIGTCLDESPDDLSDFVKSLFQDRGYYRAKVNRLELKPGDPLAHPKPVVIAADVLEGSRYTLTQIRFIGNHAFTDAQLRSAFPTKNGEFFQRGKIAEGLDKLRELYVSDGFLDFATIVDDQALSDSTVVLTLKTTEGAQYHLGKLEIFAPTDLADKLRAQWHLPEGAVFNRSYLLDYVRANHALLPASFVPQDMQVVRDCPNATVEVRILVDPILAASHPASRDVECEKTQAGSP